MTDRSAQWFRHPRDRFRQPLDRVVLTAAEWARLPELSPGLHHAIEAGRIV